MTVIAPKDASKIEILREFAEYGSITSDMKFEFTFDERENMLDIIEAHNLDALVKGKNDVETAIALMNWLCQNYKHGNPPGWIYEGGKPTPQAIMEAADKWESRTNCRGLSLILAQLIRAFGIKAFHITCMPYEEPFDDCHVVVCAYCESIGKTIILDPTYNLYIRNKSGETIGVEEFRDILIAGDEIKFNDDYFSHLCSLENYRDYMAKNLIRIRRYEKNNYGADSDDGFVILVPEKYKENEGKLLGIDEQAAFVTSRDYFWQI
ncbi:MAG: hypothetical protein FWC73_11900 [Defluviitaleaceae bacterium]|nr:hypothetical protein [Defluviitaleaceae bacterium]